MTGPAPRIPEGGPPEEHLPRLAGARALSVMHVSADFPDPIDAAKTPVIRTLLELTRDGFDHQVISLNRRAPRLQDVVASDRDQPMPFEWGDAQVYRAPACGLFHAAMLRRLGRHLADLLAPACPDLIVGHKLTVEGLAVAEAARILHLPYAITIQGNTDAKILAARPDLALRFASVFHGAQVVFSFAPWALNQVEKRLGQRTGSTVLLPCPTDLDTPIAPVMPGAGMVSAFHLRHMRNKNLSTTASALRLLHKQGQAVPFTLLGGGNDAERARCRAQLRGIPGVSLAGTLSREDMARALNRGTGFVLPSHRESFGLVFIEALFAGLPVVYPENRAVSGWFDDLPFAIPVDPDDPKALAAAMRRLVLEESSLKQALAKWQHSQHALQFTRPHIAERFSAGLELAASVTGGKVEA